MTGSCAAAGLCGAATSPSSPPVLRGVAAGLEGAELAGLPFPGDARLLWTCSSWSVLGKREMTALTWSDNFLPVDAFTPFE